MSEADDLRAKLTDELARLIKERALIMRHFSRQGSFDDVMARREAYIRALNEQLGHPLDLDITCESSAYTPPEAP